MNASVLLILEIFLLRDLHLRMRESYNSLFRLVVCHTPPRGAPQATGDTLLTALCDFSLRMRHRARAQSQRGRLPHYLS